MGFSWAESTIKRGTNQGYGTCSINSNFEIYRYILSSCNFGPGKDIHKKEC